ncbi:MAG: phenylalanine--tRNA ligase subunit beta, partial [Actinomycetes bacterium]
MRVPMSWLREFVAVPAEASARDVADAIVSLGLEVEGVDTIGEVSGPLVVGRVEQITELTEFKKPIRLCQVCVGTEFGGVRGIVCGANNFLVGDLVAVALPGSVLPGGFEISARKTYGHVSDGMICSARELGLGEEHDGIMVLPADCAEPGTSATEVLGLGERVLDIAVTPDRGYALSIRGVAREVAFAYRIPFNDPGTALAPLPQPDAHADREPFICASGDLSACDVFTVRTLLGVDVKAPTPTWMSSRLIAAGMRPINIIVDVTNYVMLELGQPLHAFDLDKLAGSLTARRAIQGEKLTTLDHIDRVLNSEDLVIADESGPLALAGTMGGLSSEIDDTTTALVLEAAHFNEVAVARMSRRHKLSSEASRRFERGVDPALAPYASDRAAALLLELAGGHNVGMVGGEAPHTPVTIELAASRPAEVAGMAIPADEGRNLLEAVGCEVSVSADGNAFTVVAPSWRPDLTDPADLVEEVVRLIGYDKIPSRLPQAPAGRGLTVDQLLRRRAGRAAAAVGLVETLAYPFIGAADLTKTGIGDGDPRARLVTLANPISEEQPGMRTTLLPGLFAIAARNLSRGADAVGIFEIGSVYFPAPGTAAAAPRPAVTTRPSDEELAD